jgi:hypothetical protein
MLSVQIKAELIRESDKALLVKLVDSGRTLWVPKSIGHMVDPSAVQYHLPHQLPAEFRKPQQMALQVPQWFWDRVKP